MTARLTSFYRFVFGSVLFFAFSYQFYVSCIVSDFNVVSFFSYFTVISNILAGVMFLYLSVYEVKKHSRNFAIFRGAVTLYMAITGIIYWTLLHRFLTGSVLWIDLYAHGIMPIVVFLDWFFNPPEYKLSYRLAFAWLIFPLFYLSYTEVRGTLTKWYPYPFLTPSDIDGYMGVFLYSMGILLLFLFIGLFLIFWGNTRKRLRKKKWSFYN